jgi:hypothetical protein
MRHFEMKQFLAEQHLEQFVIMNEEVVMFDSICNEVTLNKPIYIKLTVLDVSKLLIFDFHSKVIAKHYGNNARLLFTDTDSLYLLPPDYGRLLWPNAGIQSSIRQHGSACRYGKGHNAFLWETPNFDPP